MKLILSGKINRTYVQTLCMMFWHGEKFPENETDSSKKLIVSTEDTAEGIKCECELTICGQTVKEASFVPLKKRKI